MAYVRFCVLPLAGEYPLRLLRTVRGARVAAGTDCGCYEGEFSGVGFAGSSLEIEPIMIDGTVRVSGERLESSECARWVPTPAPVPKVSYRLSAPARVETGTSFEARLELTTDTPIAGLSAAMAVEPERIAVEAVEPNPALFMDVYAFIASVGKDGTIGIAMIPDLLGNGSILPGEHILVARILCAARSDAPEGVGAIRFISKVVHDETQIVAADPYYYGNRNSRLVYRNRIGLRLDHTVSVFDPEILEGWAEVGSLAGAALELRAERLFSRGDADRNGHVAITDAIVILRYLFSGDAALPCEDAATPTTLALRISRMPSSSSGISSAVGMRHLLPGRTPPGEIRPQTNSDVSSERPETASRGADYVPSR